MSDTTLRIWQALLLGLFALGPWSAKAGPSYLPESLESRVVKDKGTPYCFLPLEPVQDANLHVVYLSSGSLRDFRMEGDVRWRDVEVRVEGLSTSSVLLLISEAPINWTVTGPGAKDLAGVHISASNLVEVSGFPEDVALTAILGNPSSLEDGGYCNLPARTGLQKSSAEEFRDGALGMSALKGGSPVGHLFLRRINAAAKLVGLGKTVSFQRVRSPRIVVSQAAEQEFQLRVQSGLKQFESLEFDLPEISAPPPRKRLLISKERAQMPGLADWIVDQGYAMWLDWRVIQTLCAFDSAYAQATGLLSNGECRYGGYGPSLNQRHLLLTGVIEAHPDAFHVLNKRRVILKVGKGQVLFFETFLELNTVDLDVLDLPAPY